jgi:Zn-dependent alcohol dehydrogenase
VVVEVGPGVTTLQPGDHVSASFIPSCGRCRLLLHRQAEPVRPRRRAFVPGQITDGTHRHHKDGQGLNLFAKLGTFSEHTCRVEASGDQGRRRPAVPGGLAGQLRGGHRLRLGVKRADTQPGDTVVVVGCGGVGMNAVQGPRSPVPST